MISTIIFMYFVIGKFCGILFDILSGILFGIPSRILSGISSDILSDIFSDILPVEVRQCPLGSGARSGGPAVPTGIWTARRRRRVRRRRRQRRRRRRRRTALIKSNNPHLAGGEIQKILCYTKLYYIAIISSLEKSL